MTSNLSTSGTDGPGRRRRTRAWRLGLAALAALALSVAGLAALPQRGAHAAGLQLSVTDCTSFAGTQADKLSLGTALDQVKANADGGAISFACDGTFVVPATIGVGNTLAILGNGHAVTLDGDWNVRLFAVQAGGNLTLDGLTVTRGSSSGGWGGALYSEGIVHITGSTFTGNEAIFDDLSGRETRGGAVWSGGGELYITNSTFSHNGAQGGTDLFNGADGRGGAVDNEGGKLDITNSTFEDNIVIGGVGTFSNGAAYGGAIYNNAAGQALTITNSTFTGNEAGATATIDLPWPFSHIHVTSPGYGAAVMNDGGNATITNGTFTGNNAVGGGNGGVSNSGASASMTLANSIVAGNAVNSNASAGSANCGGTITDGGYNLTFPSATGCPSTFTAANPMLDTQGSNHGLWDNGGPTQTIALLAGSPAINQIDPGTNGCGATITADQRGIARPQGSACDIGAFEVEVTDTIPPTTEVSTVPPEPAGAGWYTGDVAVTLTAEDNEDGSGVKSITYSATGAQPIGETTVEAATATFTISAEGTTTITYYATDNVPNVESPKSKEIKIDRTAPTTIEASISPNANTAGWNNADVKVNLTAIDNAGGSGVTETKYTVNDGAAQTYDAATGIVFNSDGQYTIAYWSVDNAGNEETHQALSRTVKLDKTAPSVSCGSADGQWHNDNVSIACTASDSGSGLANSTDASFNLTTSVAAGTQTDNASTDSRMVKDVADNSTTAGPITGNQVDRKAPDITLTTPTDDPNGAAIYLYQQDVTANYACDDTGGSGVASCTGTVANGSKVDTSIVGKHEFTVTAKDNVGNTATKTVSYDVIYAWSGFLPPITADSRTSFRAGSTVPVKFQLTGDSAGVTDAVVTIYVTRVGDETADEVAPDSNSAPDDGNTFRYDPTSDQYIYNLSTKGLTAGTYRLTLYVGGDNTTGVLQGQVDISLR